MLVHSCLIRTTYSFLNHYSKSSAFFHKKNYSLNLKYTKPKMFGDVKSREDPIVLKVDSPEFKSILTPEVIDLKKIFDKYNYEIRIAGGAVRDILMGKAPKDVDFATTATPQEMKDMFAAEEVRLINMNGEKHGTITPRINDKENFEVTTLRIDVVTDGRRADVKFTTDWKLDANRRDLTINSMFLGFDGSVYDYFFGYEDLMARRVVFVGSPDTRIKEDYLRILRYFRFYGRISEKPNNHDEATLETISQNVGGLEIISGERIWMELKKILEANFAGDILKTMLHVGIGKYAGLPDSPNILELERVWKIAQTTKLHAITLLSSLFNDLDDAINLHNRIKLSSFERDLAFFIVEHWEDKPNAKPLLPYQKLLLHTKLKPKVCREYIEELLKYKNRMDLLEQFNKWEVPVFPINGATLQENGVKIRKLFGNVMNGLKEYWADRDFNVSKEELIEQIPAIYDIEVQDMNDRSSNKNETNGKKFRKKVKY